MGMRESRWQWCAAVCAACACVSMLCACMPAYARSLIVPDAGNKMCPVTGTRITAKKYSATYQGKRYWFSSGEARLRFKENPARYADSL